MSTFKKYRTYLGERQKFCGGYVRMSDGMLKEVQVWVAAKLDVSDCGEGTDTLVKAVAEKAKKSVGMVSEVFQY